jgi:hypothetical protein
MIIKAEKNNKEIDVLLVGTKGYQANLIITYKCDNCGKEKTILLQNLLKNQSLDKQLCLSCSIKVNDTVSTRKKTCLQKYGQDNPMKVAKLKEKHNKKFISNGGWNNQKVNFDQIKKEFIKRGYILLTKEEDYKNHFTKLEFICPEGHQHNISWSSFRRGRGCNICGYKEVSRKKSNTYEYVKEQFEKEGYTLVSKEYKGNKKKLEFICPNGHLNKIRFDNWISGVRCASCSHIISKTELEIYSYIKYYFPDAIHNDRILISPLELDIIVPDKKIAIEYCGLYWHSEKNGKDSKYHLNKLESCNKKGYKLITIFEDEWVHKTDIVKSRLLNLLGINENKVIHARKCVIKEIKAKIKNKFLNQFHIQGNDKSQINIGAFYNNNLVSVMTFSNGSIAKGSKLNKNIYELSRFCSNSDYKITGIASRLLKYFIKNYNPKEIYSYADRRWSDGNLYKILGFEFIHNTKSNYWYIDGDKRIHRFNFRKSVLKDKLENFNPDLTEKQNMKNNGYNRIYDCGNIKFSMKFQGVI